MTRFGKKAWLAAGLSLGLLAGTAAQASVVIDFNAVALRGANASPYTPPTVTESADGTRATISSLQAGQKAYYGTSYFGGETLGTIDSISFSYRPGSLTTPAPYVNFAVTDGTVTGVLTFAFSYNPVITDLGGGNFSAVYDLTPATTMRLVEISTGAAAYDAAFSTFSNWTFLDVDRALSPGELLPGVVEPGPRGPVSDSLVVMWGDSAGNYAGEKEIFGVTVNTLLASGAPGEQYIAGNVVPEPASLALAGIAILGLAATTRRRKPAA